MYNCETTRKLHTRLRELSTTPNWRSCWCQNTNHKRMAENTQIASNRKSCGIIKEAILHRNFKARTRPANKLSSNLRGHTNRKFPSILSVTPRWSCSQTDKSNCCSHDVLFREATCGFKRRSAVSYALHSGVRKTPSYGCKPYGSYSHQASVAIFCFHESHVRASRSSEQFFNLVHSPRSS